VCVSACTNSFLISMQGTELIVFGSKFHYHLPFQLTTLFRRSLDSFFAAFKKVKLITIASPLNNFLHRDFIAFLHAHCHQQLLSNAVIFIVRKRKLIKALFIILAFFIFLYLYYSTLVADVAVREELHLKWYYNHQSHSLSFMLLLDGGN
jgi:hypothetical protein